MRILNDRTPQERGSIFAVETPLSFPQSDGHDSKSPAKCFGSSFVYAPINDWWLLLAPTQNDDSGVSVLVNQSQPGSDPWVTHTNTVNIAPRRIFAMQISQSNCEFRRERIEKTCLSSAQKCLVLKWPSLRTNDWEIIWRIAITTSMSSKNTRSPLMMVSVPNKFQ